MSCHSFKLSEISTESSCNSNANTCLLWMLFAPGPSLSARDTRWHVFPQLVFSDIRAETHVLAPSSPRDGRPAVQCCLSSALKHGCTTSSSSKLKVGSDTAARNCISYGREVNEGKDPGASMDVKDEFELTNVIPSKAEFSYGVTVMERICGRIDGGRIEGVSKI